jgi:hypothetical protein
VIGAFVITGIIGAVVIPNRLDWKSDNPYLESAKGVVNFREGSGRGRLIQYRTSARMALDEPLLGVGPGNWGVEYPRVATRDDPSLSREAGLTANPWPSSDWVAFLSERGIPAVALLLFVMVATVLAASVRMWEASRRDEFLTALSLAATVVIAVIVGMFDAVLLLAAPTFVVWGIIGVQTAGASAPRGERTIVVTDGARRWWIFAVALVGLLATLRAGTQMRAMAIFHTSTRLSDLEEASRLDPGSYRMRIRLADAYARRGDCRRVREHASAARALFPNAAEPKRLLKRCGK